jgi:diguanylate cyclase (GGDEF)-like protein
LRDDDVICRIGGEEFAVILDGVDVDKAAELADRIRARIEEADTAAGTVTSALE